jgi:hypothetical protein
MRLRQQYISSFVRRYFAQCTKSWRTLIGKVPLCHGLKLPTAQVWYLSRAMASGKTTAQGFLL